MILLWPYSPAAGIGVLALSHMLVLYPTLRPNVQWLGPVITHFEPNGNELWLTIDDGPADDTPALLDMLDRHDVQATFFVKGTLVELHPERVTEIVARGHSVANHSQTHPAGSFWCALPARVTSEVDACNRVLAKVAGGQPRWFRAPVGMKNPSVHPILARRGMRLIGWSARGFDGVMTDVNEIVARIVPRLAPGAIVVLHQGLRHSLPTIERVIVAAKERGYTFVLPRDGQLRAGR